MRRVRLFAGAFTLLAIPLLFAGQSAGGHSAPAKILHAWPAPGAALVSASRTQHSTALSADLCPQGAGAGAGAGVKAHDVNVSVSTNWAGVEYGDATFGGISGDWTVPLVAASNTLEGSSTWIGIDDGNDANDANGDLLRIGTAQDTDSGGDTYCAWYEILPGGTVNQVPDFPVAPHDEMAASIQQNSPGSWTISLEDVTQGNNTFSQVVSYGGPADSAEWIEEAPTSAVTQTQDLANFGTVSFTQTMYAADTSAAQQTVIFMGDPTSNQVLAYPNNFNASGFSVTYGPPPPVVSSVSPASGPAGTAVTINGDWFDQAGGVSRIDFGGTSASFSCSSAFVCSATAPSGPSGTVDITATTGAGTTPTSSADQFTYSSGGGGGPAQHGYWLVGGDGGIFTFGAAQFYGSTGNLILQRPVVGITPTSTRAGYWLVATDGGIFSFGDSTFVGSIPGLGIAPAGTRGTAHVLSAPIVGMVPSASGHGYFLVGSDGGVFAFGDAQYEGSCPGIGGCSGPAVAVMPDATGQGYWLVTSTGAVYGFGDAPDFGGPAPQSVAVTSAMRTPDGGGYWILYANGAIADFGDAGSFGSPLGQASGANPANAIFATADGGGYWVATANGGVFSYGDAPNDGGMAGQHLNAPIIAATGW